MASSILRRGSQIWQLRRMLQGQTIRVGLCNQVNNTSTESWIRQPSRKNPACQYFSTICETPTDEAKLQRNRMLNRLLYRSKQRGFLELDLVLGKWTEENIHKLDDTQLKSLIEVLDVENPELWKWLTGQEVIPESLSANPIFMEIHKQIMGALKAHSATATRAKLGQPWVRGWDDNRKIGGPQVGNQ